MRYEIVLPPTMAQELHSHLLGDRSCEQMAITLCGVSKSQERTRLLARHLILMPPSAFICQSACGLTLHPNVQQFVLKCAAQEGLSQIDWHTHPGDGKVVNFSGVDNHSEREMAAYITHKLPGTLYASVVLNSQAMSARVWEIHDGRPLAVPISPPELGTPQTLPLLRELREQVDGNFNADRFDRQVRAFGPEFQRRLVACKVGIVGVGGLGSIMVEQLARLGVRYWVLVEPDRLEASNLNRVVGATARDAKEKRYKVSIAMRNIKHIEPHAQIKYLRCSVFTRRALTALKDCDVLIATTDDDASRLVLNAFACQYLIPIVHVGVNLEPGDDGTFQDISGEFAIPSLGSWCLLCAGIIDAQRASRDMASAEERSLLAQRGYLHGTPAPAVYHLNNLVASLAVTEIHNLIWPYKPIHRYMAYRELEGELMPIGVSPSENCMHCGPEGRRGLGDLIPFWIPKPSRSFEEMGIPMPVSEQPTETETLVGVAE